MCYHVVSRYAVPPTVCFTVSVLTMKCHTLVILVLFLRHNILPVVVECFYLVVNQQSFNNCRLERAAKHFDANDVHTAV